MRKRILIAALLTTGVWAAARFTPTSEAGPTGTTGSDRKILLVEGARTEAPVVSALEAGLPTRLTDVRPVAEKAPRRAAVGTGTAGQSVAEAMHDHAAMGVAELAPAMHMSTTSTLLAPQSAPGTLPVVQASGIALVFGSDQPEQRPAGGGFEPAIIIRGGMGGARDDCDLHRRRGGGVGIAINRSVPSFGGYGDMGRSRSAYPSGTRLH